MKIFSVFAHKRFDDLGQPKPIKQFIPQWWRDAETQTPDGQSGLKRCIPFFDAMLSGYCLVTPYPLFVSKNEDGSLNVRWNAPGQYTDFVMQRPDELGSTMPRPPGHHHTQLIFRNVWGMRTPRGWSLLITHPLNRHDLPFTTTSGIIDADEFSASGNIPFFLKEDFVGIIPAGTPYAQLIPIKRASWVLNKNNKGLVPLEHIHADVVRQPGKSYKKLMWHRKDFN